MYHYWRDWDDDPSTQENVMPKLVYIVTRNERGLSAYTIAALFHEETEADTFSRTMNQRMGDVNMYYEVLTLEVM